MRWSRLKKTINPDDIASPISFSPAKPHATPKSQKEPKETKQLVKEVLKEKRSERKAKIKAGEKIGMVVKMQEEEEEEEEEEIEETETVNEKGSDNTDGRNDESQEKPKQGDVNSTVPEAQGKEASYIKLETEQAPNTDITLGRLQDTQPPFGLFHPPPPLHLALLPSIVSATELGDEAHTKAWPSPTTAVKQEPSTLSPTFTKSPGSSSSFSPTFSSRSSESPTARIAKQPERTAQKRRADNKFRARKSRNRSQKSADYDDEELED